MDYPSTSTVNSWQSNWKRKHLDDKKSRRKDILREAANRACSAFDTRHGRNLPPLPNVSSNEEEGLETLVHHPYGVLPFGNIYLNEDDSSKGDVVRHLGLGPILKCFSDEHIISIFGFLDGSSLALLSACSRFLYVAAHYDDLWRDLTLRKFQKGFMFVKGGMWKDTYIWNTVKSIDSCKNHIIHTPIHVQGIFSDTFYRPWLCRSFHIQPNWLDSENIPTEHISTLTVERFITQYEGPNIPLLIRDATLTWPAIHKWVDQNYLLQHTTNVLFRATSGAAPLAANFTMQSYIHYCDSSSRSMEEAPLYLFDRSFDITCPQFKTDYEDALKSTCPFFDPDAAHGHDLFGLLGKDARPDHRWLIAGPKRSGSSFHIDPNATHAWNVPIMGRKRWIFYPPGVSPPGIYPDASGDEVIMPISLGEWFLTYYDQHVARRSDPDPKKRPLECTVGPGDLLFVPHGWWHCVLNLDDGMNIAITQNYVSSTNLPDVLRFLEHKPQQISGCRDRPEAIKPDQLLEAFVSSLRKHGPSLLTTAQELANQGWHCNAWEDDKPQGQLNEMDCNNILESSAKRRKGTSVMEQAKQSHVIDDASHLEKKKEEEGFMFSFL